jgi:SAM-dependent methyltransferase
VGKITDSNHWLELRDGNKIRTTEFESSFKSWGSNFKGPLLELGSGDGTQYKQLKQYIDNITPSDVNTDYWPAELGEIKNINAEKMPFEDGSFKTIYSSNVLEHIPDVDTALVEMKRILDKNGAMIHIVPTVTWKLLQLGLYHVSLVRNWIAKGKRLERFRPCLIHGVSKSSIEEIGRFKGSYWRKRFNGAGLKIVDTKCLLTYSPYRFTPNFILLRSILAKIGFASTKAYLIHK